MRGEDLNWLGKALAFLFTTTLFMMAVPSVYLRAIISLAVFAILVMYEKEDPNTGTLKRSVLASVLAFLMTLPLLPFSRVEIGVLDPSILLEFSIFHLSVATWEEAVYRGYPLLRFSGGALIASSLAFSIIHIFNPGFGPQAFVGIFLAGLALGVMRYEWGLAPSISMHFTWNILMEHIWGYPTSGLRGPSILRSELTGPDLITGGDFGPEASVVVMIEFLLLLLALRFVRLNDRLP